MLPSMTQEQQANLVKIQEVTQHIKAKVHKGVDGSITVSFITNNEQAKAVLPQIQEALVSSTANVLHMLFGISGEVS